MNSSSCLNLTQFSLAFGYQFSFIYLISNVRMEYDERVLSPHIVSLIIHNTFLESSSKRCSRKKFVLNYFANFMYYKRSLHGEIIESRMHAKLQGLTGIALHLGIYA